MQSLYKFLLTFSLSQILKEACYTHRPNLLVVILNEFDADLYQAVKRFGDITAGVVTQCIVCFTHSELHLALTHQSVEMDQKPFGCERQTDESIPR